MADLGGSPEEIRKQIGEWKANVTSPDLKIRSEALQNLNDIYNDLDSKSGVKGGLESGWLSKDELKIGDKTPLEYASEKYEAAVTPEEKAAYELKGKDGKLQEPSKIQEEMKAEEKAEKKENSPALPQEAQEAQEESKEAVSQPDSPKQSKSHTETITAAKAIQESLTQSNSAPAAASASSERNTQTLATAAGTRLNASTSHILQPTAPPQTTAVTGVMPPPANLQQTGKPTTTPTAEQSATSVSTPSTADLANQKILEKLERRRLEAQRAAEEAKKKAKQKKGSQSLASLLIRALTEHPAEGTGRSVVEAHTISRGPKRQNSIGGR